MATVPGGLPQASLLGGREGRGGRRRAGDGVLPDGRAEEAGLQHLDGDGGVAREVARAQAPAGGRPEMACVRSVAGPQESVQGLPLGDHDAVDEEEGAACGLVQARASPLAEPDAHVPTPNSRHPASQHNSDQTPGR